MSLTDRCSATAGSQDAFVERQTSRAEVGLRIELAHGGTADVALRYELIGRHGAPLLLVAGGISAGRHVVASEDLPEPGWWQVQAGSFDLSRFRLLAFDWIGADGRIDLPIDPADQAEAVRQLVDYLGLDRLAGFIGASYGAMVGMHFAAAHPQRCGALLAISAAGAAHPYASACRSLQRRALDLGNPAAGVALARAMAMLTYRTPNEFADRFAVPPNVVAGRVRVGADTYLDVQGERHASRMSPTAYRRLSESIDLHRIDPAKLAVPLTLVAVDSDALVPPADVAAFASAIPSATFWPIASHYGHDAFLKEEAAVAEILATFLSSLESA